VSCFSLSEIRQEGIKILEKESEVVKLIQQSTKLTNSSGIAFSQAGMFSENAISCVSLYIYVFILQQQLLTM
jgi:hypothetical protein